VHSRGRGVRRRLIHRFPPRPTKRRGLDEPAACAYPNKR
jgi:hypothetical protein